MRAIDLSSNAYHTLQRLPIIKDDADDYFEMGIDQDLDGKIGKHDPFLMGPKHADLVSYCEKRDLDVIGPGDLKRGFVCQTGRWFPSRFNMDDLLSRLEPLSNRAQWAIVLNPKDSSDSKTPRTFDLVIYEPKV